MALPQFTKAGVGTVTFSERGQVFPLRRTIQTGLVLGYTDALQTVATRYATRKHIHSVTFEGLPGADWTQLDTFLWHPLIDGSRGTFTWTDERGVARLVRWIVEATFEFSETSEGRYTATLVLRQEA